MNRELQMNNSRRTVSRKAQRGGGYGMGAPLVPIPSGPGSDWNFAVKEPVNQGFDDCLFPARPGQLFNAPQPSIAQAGWPTLGGAGGGEMSGGKRSRKQRRRRGRKAQRGGGVAEDALVEGGIVYYYNPVSDEIHKHVINEVDDAYVYTVRDFGTSTFPIMIRREEILGDNNFDTQLTILRGDHPTARVSFPENANGNANTVVAVPNESGNEVPQTGGGTYDAIEDSHAYHHNGWTQELSHGATPATLWGRDTGLVQTVMVGGGIDPIEASHAYPPNGWETPSTHGAPLPTWGPQTGLAQEAMVGGKKRRASAKKQRGGGCPCTGSRLFGGARRRASRRQQRGGSNYGYAIDPSVSIGGSGPNVDALRTGVPCDPRPGSIDPSNPQLPLDPRAYGQGYSATPNTTLPSLQAGGAYSTGNAYPDSCYKAPHSELPVYNAQTAGFNFYPSTAHNGTLPDGVTPYNDVVPYAARMGGARRKSRKAPKGRKAHKGRKGSKGRKGRKDNKTRRH